MAGLEAPWELMGSSPERGRRRGAGGTPGEGEGYRGHHGGGRSEQLAAPACSLLHVVCRKKEGAEGRREGRKKKRKEKKKEKNYGKFFKLENF
jgi:hypothetical protein